MDAQEPREQFEEEPEEEAMELESPLADSTREPESASEPEQDQTPADREPQLDLPQASEPEAESRSEPAREDRLLEEIPQEEVEPEEVESEEAEKEPEPAPAARPTPGLSVPSEALADISVEGPAWFVIHCYSGYENKVRHNLEQRIETMGMKDKIFDVVIPTQEEIEVREGRRRTVERHIFPGYVLVNMILTEESWYVVRNTPGVTGFVGMGNSPTPLRPEEVSQIIKRMEAEAPTVKVTFKVGERVRIIDGPFNDFRGTVSEIDMERTKVRVMVSFFGRETPVELDFLQVEKA